MADHLPCEHGHQRRQCPHCENAALTERLREAEGLLWELEWSAGQAFSTCPQCRALEADGHAPGCRLAAFAGIA